MGRYDFRPQRVLAAANLAFETRQVSNLPAWHQVIQDIPPPPRLPRPVIQRKRRVKRNAYKPASIFYPEDNLRKEFFGDHPWELARPTVIVEDSGNDHKHYDWSTLEQDGKKLDGESVVQHQMWLMENKGLSQARAYDIARKEFYQHRHLEDVERRIAKEEALHSGAYFNIGPNAMSQPLEDAKFEKWKEWAASRITQMQQRRSAGYSGTDADDEAGGGSAVGAKLSPQAQIAEETLASEALHEANSTPVPEALPAGSREALAAALRPAESR